MRRIILGAAIAGAGLTAGGVALAQIADGVATPNAATPGTSPATILASKFDRALLAKGSDQLENPIGIFTTYGYLDDSTDPLSRTRTEPDQNTYLNTSENPGGPTPGYDYGRHFLIQGHENGGNKAYLTRINLDVTDPAHRITLLNAPAQDGTTNLTSIDGSTYDPFTGQLLFTSESGGKTGGVAAVPLRWGSSTTVPAPTRYDGSLGRGGYEGIQVDSEGSIYVVEDAGGATVKDDGVQTSVKQPGSFVFRFKPDDARNLSAGRLQVLQVLVDGTPLSFHDRATSSDAEARNDALGTGITRLHSGETLKAKWITIHDTDADGTEGFDANALAKAQGATPLKRPENGKFVPGSDFASFVVTETGDTNDEGGDYPGAEAAGAWGSLLRIDMPEAGADTATVRTILRGDETHNSFDNLVFLDKDTLLTAEDRGDELHTQLNTLDSVWSVDLGKSFEAIKADAKRLVALGRDPEATLKGDNEPTGIFVSNGATSRSDLLGARDPAEQRGVRIFYTEQHGQNTTYEVLPKGSGAPQGQPGPDGKPGPTGPAGPKGPRGDRGPEGTFVILVLHLSEDGLPARVTAPSAGTVSLALTARSHGHRISLGKATRTFAAAGTRRLTLKPSLQARRLLRANGRTKATVIAKLTRPSGATRTIRTSTTVRG